VAVLVPVLDVGGVDRDAARLLSGAASIWSYALPCPAVELLSTDVMRRRQRRLAVVNVPDRATLTCGLVRSNFFLPFSGLRIKEQCRERFKVPTSLPLGRMRPPAAEEWDATNYLPRDVTSSATFSGL
jgi:hypothetical protein